MKIKVKLDNNKVIYKQVDNVIYLPGIGFNSYAYKKIGHYTYYYLPAGKGIYYYSHRD